jgi:malate synthase
VVNEQLEVTLNNGTKTELKNGKQFVGYWFSNTGGSPSNPSHILLRNNGLYIDIQFDDEHLVGRDDPAFIKDVVLESAITTIQDCEDSVAAVDGEDKTEVYRNWLGLMKGTLTDTFQKNGREMTRTLAPDLHALNPAGEPITLHGRAVMLIRNVGHLMTN